MTVVALAGGSGTFAAFLIVMFFGVVLAVTSLRHGADGDGKSASSRGGKSAGSRSSFTQRMEERFRQRFEEQ